jgi:glycosyltransferase involved in cell wall biosynthesis
MHHSRADATAPDISVVLPMRDEEGAAASLCAEIASALKGRRFEIIVVDDGSRDGTRAVVSAAQRAIPQLRLLAHEMNAGQSRAVRSGVLAARGRIVATLDGDGQNDPADLPALVDRLARPDRPPTLAMVAGERRKREDSAAKRFASRVANRVRQMMLHDGANDTGCGVKAFEREAYLRLPYFDHNHRYLPALMRREGYLIEFLAVGHRPRLHGRSKYTNIGRLAVAFRDLLGVVWLLSRARSPGRISEIEADSGHGIVHRGSPGEGLARVEVE